MNKLYIFNEEQYDEVLDYLAEQEELQQRDLGHLTPISMDSSIFVLRRAIRHAIAYEQKMEYPEQDIKQLKAMLEALPQED